MTATISLISKWYIIIVIHTYILILIHTIISHTNSNLHTTTPNSTLLRIPTMMSSSTETCVLEQYESVDYLQFYRVSMFITGLICYPIICVYGLVGNCLILVVMSRKSMQSSTNVYLSALAVSDTLKLVNDLLYSVRTV